MVKQQPGGSGGNGQEKYETGEFSISTGPYMGRRGSECVCRVGHQVCVFVMHTKPLLKIPLFCKCKLVFCSSCILKCLIVFSFTSTKLKANSHISTILSSSTVGKYQCAVRCRHGLLSDLSHRHEDMRHDLDLTALRLDGTLDLKAKTFGIRLKCQVLTL